MHIKVYIDGHLSQNKAVEDKEIVIISRSSKSDVVVKIPDVSGEHLRIVNEAGRFFLIDNNTLNGSFINGDKMEASKKYEYTPGHSIHLSKNVVIEIDFSKLDDEFESESGYANDTPSMTSTENIGLDFTAVRNLLSKQPKRSVTRRPKPVIMEKEEKHLPMPLVIGCVLALAIAYMYLKV